jgi:hypothetical protein
MALPKGLLENIARGKAGESLHLPCLPEDPSGDLNDDAIRALAEALRAAGKNGTVKQLHFREQPIHDDGARALADMLREGETRIEYIDLTSSLMTGAGVRAIFEAVRDMETPPRVECSGDKAWDTPETAALREFLRNSTMPRYNIRDRIKSPERPPLRKRLGGVLKGKQDAAALGARAMNEIWQEDCRQVYALELLRAGAAVDTRETLNAAAYRGHELIVDHLIPRMDLDDLELAHGMAVAGKQWEVEEKLYHIIQARCEVDKELRIRNESAEKTDPLAHKLHALEEESSALETARRRLQVPCWVPHKPEDLTVGERLFIRAAHKRDMAGMLAVARGEMLERKEPPSSPVLLAPLVPRAATAPAPSVPAPKERGQTALCMAFNTGSREMTKALVGNLKKRPDLHCHN